MNQKAGILLINLGTPEATSFGPMRRYLKEFLSDKRVIEKRGLIWWLVLNGIILMRRPKRSGHAYDQIWNRDLDESPLKTVTRSQATRLSRLPGNRDKVAVDWAMRYGQPPIADGIARLQVAGCERILLFPLYPQYSAPTTASALDKAYDALGKMRVQPAICTVPPYYNHPAYIGALAASVRTHLDGLDWVPDALITSFHGLPVEFIEQGDPYQGHCEKTAHLLGDELAGKAGDMQLAYQSSPGRGVWLGPDLEQALREHAQNGRRNICVISPGFATDCVETLEEIQIRARQVFLDAGGENFAFIRCLNDSDTAIEMLNVIAGEQLTGWH